MGCSVCGELLFMPCWGLNVSTGLLLHRGTSPGQEHQPLWLVQR